MVTFPDRWLPAAFQVVRPQSFPSKLGKVAPWAGVWGSRGTGGISIPSSLLKGTSRESLNSKWCNWANVLSHVCGG